MKNTRMRLKLVLPSILPIAIAALLVGCASFGSRESVTVAGTVVDWETGESAKGVWVSVNRLVRGFPMGRFDEVARLETSEDGRFEFSIEKKATVDVYTQDSENSITVGSICTFDRINEDRRELVILHCREGVSNVCWDEYRTLDRFLESFPKSAEVCTDGAEEAELQRMTDELLHKFGKGDL